MKLHHINSIEDLINHRIVIEHHQRNKVVDILSYNPSDATVLIEYQFKPGENTTQRLSLSRIISWIAKAAQLRHLVM